MSSSDMNFLHHRDGSRKLHRVWYVGVRFVFGLWQSCGRSEESSGRSRASPARLPSAATTASSHPPHGVYEVNETLTSSATDLGFYVAEKTAVSLIACYEAPSRPRPATQEDRCLRVRDSSRKSR